MSGSTTDTLHGQVMPMPQCSFLIQKPIASFGLIPFRKVPITFGFIKGMGFCSYGQTVNQSITAWKRSKILRKRFPYGSPTFSPIGGANIKKSTCFFGSRCFLHVFQILPVRGISRALKTVHWTVFVRRSKRRTRAVRFPYGSPGFCPFPRAAHKEKHLPLKKQVLW